MREKVWLPVVIYFIGTLAMFAQAGSSHINEVAQEELSKGVLVDVRTPAEFSSGHMDGAINIDWLGGDFIGQVSELPKSKRVYLYCQKGGRSARAAKVLDSLGYDVVDLRGGYQEFSKKDGPE